MTEMGLIQKMENKWINAIEKSTSYLCQRDESFVGVGFSGIIGIFMLLAIGAITCLTMLIVEKFSGLFQHKPFIKRYE